MDIFSPVGGELDPPCIGLVLACLTDTQLDRDVENLVARSTPRALCHSQVIFEQVYECQGTLFCRGDYCHHGMLLPWGHGVVCSGVWMVVPSI